MPCMARGLKPDRSDHSAAWASAMVALSHWVPIARALRRWFNDSATDVYTFLAGDLRSSNQDVSGGAAPTTTVADLVGQLQNDTAPALALRLGLDGARLLRLWLAASGIPEWLVFVPSHLAAYAGRYSDPDLWPSLYGLQHDEKDMFRVVGRAGLQDWGDGDCQERLAALDAATDDLGEVAKALRAAVPGDLAAYGEARRTLQQTLALLRQYAAVADASIEQLNAKVAALRAKLAKLAMDAVKQRERLSKHLTFLAVRSSEVSSFSIHVATHGSDVDALPAAPAAAHTAARLGTMLDDQKGLLETGFGLANAPASKVLATCLCSVFDCSPWTTGALFFTVDDAKTWQIREAVYRAILSAIDVGMYPALIGADKAYMSAAHWDLRGFPLTRTAALKEVEYLTSVIRWQSGNYDVSVQCWPRTDDLRDYAEEILRDPRAAADGFVRQPWMDEFVERQTREVGRACLGCTLATPLSLGSSMRPRHRSYQK
jgi:outer membrane murein-binding lipoprotein Lpp